MKLNQVLFKFMYKILQIVLIAVLRIDKKTFSDW